MRVPMISAQWKGVFPLSRLFEWGFTIEYLLPTMCLFNRKWKFGKTHGWKDIAPFAFGIKGQISTLQKMGSLLLLGHAEAVASAWKLRVVKGRKNCTPRKDYPKLKMWLLKIKKC